MLVAFSQSFVHSQLRSHKATLSFLVSAFILSTNFLYAVYLVTCFLYFCAFSWGFHCLKWPPSRVLKFKKAGMCLTEKICIREALFEQELRCCWCEFNVNVGSTWKEEKIRWSVCEATPESAKVSPQYFMKLQKRWKSSQICGFMRWWQIKKKKKYSGLHYCEAESEGNLWSCYLESRNVKPFSASAGCLTRFERR